jgi:DNA polymerase-3 subunit epsilon
MLGADFYRAGISNPLTKLQTFCTMLSLKPQFTDGQVRLQRLNEVYERLFSAKLDGYHNAWADANATAKVFFELQKRGEINDALIESYPQLSVPKSKNIFRRLGTRLGIASMISLMLNAS